VQAFDDCTTLGSTFKLLESFEGLLERDVIAADVAVKHQDLLKTFASDIKEVQDLFDTFKAYPVLAKNAAPHSGGYSISMTAVCIGSCVLSHQLHLYRQLHWLDAWWRPFSDYAG
jgi:hypothetical protein